MSAPYIIAAVGALFLVMGSVRAASVGASHPQARTWLLVGAIFVLVSAWLFSKG